MQQESPQRGRDLADFGEEDSGAQVSSLGEGELSREEGGGCFTFERYEVSRDRISRDLLPSPNVFDRAREFEVGEDEVGRVELDDELREALEESPRRPRLSGEGAGLSAGRRKRAAGSQSSLMKASRSTGTLRSPNTHAAFS